MSSPSSKGKSSKGKSSKGKSSKGKSSEGKSPKAVAGTGQSSQASASKGSSTPRRAGAAKPSGPSPNVGSIDTSLQRVRRDPPDPALPSNLILLQPAPSLADVEASGRTLLGRVGSSGQASSSRAGEARPPRTLSGWKESQNNPDTSPAPSVPPMPSTSMPSTSMPSSSLLTRQDILGMSALKRQMVNMRTTIGSQEEPIMHCQTSLETTQLLIKVTKAKLEQAERNKDNDREIESLRRQLTEFETQLWSKEQQVNAWKLTDRKKWEVFHGLTTNMHELCLAWEFHQKPEDLKEFLRKAKVKVDEQREEISQLRRSINEPDEKIEELRKTMVQLLPKDFDSGWKRFQDEASKIEASIRAQGTEKRIAITAIIDWDQANDHCKMLKEQYVSFLLGTLRPC